MSQKNIWTIKIIAIVAIVCSLAALFILLHSCNAEGELANTLEETSLKSKHREGELIPVEEDTSAPTPAPATVDEDSPYMSYEEYFALSEEEQHAYLDLIEWDADFQSFVNSDTEDHSDDPYYYHKYFLEINPSYMVPGIGNPYGEDESFVGSTDEDIEDWRVRFEIAEQAHYSSDSVSYEYDDEGNTIQIGWDEYNDGRGIYLNPICSAATEDKPVIFQFFDDKNLRVYDEYFNFAPMDYSYGDSNYVCFDQLNNMVTPSIPAEGEWSLKWVDYSLYSGERTESTTVYGRAIDYSSGNIIASFRVEITYDEDKDIYRLEDIYDSEVLNTGDIKKLEREGIVNDTIAFLTGEECPISVNIPVGVEWETVAAQARVERLPGTYFDQFYDLELNPEYDYIVLDNCDVYAVYLPLPGMGYFTMYFAPSAQYLYGFDSPVVPGETATELIMFGFDALTPFSIDTILAVNGYVI